MSAPRNGISRAAGKLLFDILDQRSPVLSPLALRDHFPALGQELLSAGFLQPWGSSLAAVIEDFADDQPVEVVRSPDDGSYGYFSAASGWVTVPTEQLRRYRLDIPAVIRAMFSLLRWTTKAAPTPLATEDVWELGQAGLTRRGPPTEVWFARRLREQSIQGLLADLSRRRPPARGPRLILTSTPGELISSFGLPGHIVASVRDLVDPAAAIELDPGMAAARLRGVPVSTEHVWLSPDGRTLILNGTERITLTGSIQMAAIKLLAEGRVSGRSYSTSELLTRSSSKSLDQIFGREKWLRMRPYLDRDRSGWRFAI